MSCSMSPIGDLALEDRPVVEHMKFIDVSFTEEDDGWIAHEKGG